MARTVHVVANCGSRAAGRIVSQEYVDGEFTRCTAGMPSDDKTNGLSFGLQQRPSRTADGACAAQVHGGSRMVRQGRNVVLKLTFCLRRRPELTLAEFQGYWLNKHAPRVRILQPALRMTRYVQVHRLDTDLAAGMQRVRGAPEPFDGIAELWWADEASFRAAGRDPEGREAGRRLLEDEAKFIDLAASPLWLNNAHVIYPASGGSF